MSLDTDMCLPTLPADGALASSQDDSYRFQGHVDFYGYNAMSQGWFFGGWLAHPWPADNRPEGVVAHFAGQKPLGPGALVFYRRPRVEAFGIGFVAFVRAELADGGSLVDLEFAFTRTCHTAQPTRTVLVLDEPGLNAELEPILSAAHPGSRRREIWDLLRHGPAEKMVDGYIDIFGYHAFAGGWFFCGWVSRAWKAGHVPKRLLATFDRTDIEGETLAVTYTRHDLPEEAEGALFFIPASCAIAGELCSISFSVDGNDAKLFPSAPTRRLKAAPLAEEIARVLQLAPWGLPRERLLALVERRQFAGQDTLPALDTSILLEIDEAILCQPHGLVLIGWCLAAQGQILDIRVRCAGRVTKLDLTQAIKLARPDVLTAMTGRRLPEDASCGFLAYLPQAVLPDESIYIEIETYRHEVAFRPIPRPSLSGLAAIRRILGCVDSHHPDMKRAFEQIIGPAVRALNEERLSQRPGETIVDYGRVPIAPTFTVIVPLYGRLDLIEYQLALFSAHPAARDFEFIFVLDDPLQQVQARRLFASAQAAFGLPFRVVELDRNIGFGPASNAGLGHARGEFVAFVNSDVFPGTPDWLEQLGKRLITDPTIGVIGPMLLFADGSVQHEGMYFRRLPEFGNWYFGDHCGKGLRPQGAGLKQSISITGACLVMRRSLANEVGGFNEAYVIGDFEDSDLCFRLRALGYKSVVDRDVYLYHLERKSQTSSAVTWRMNLTLYNAWEHERRWAPTIAAVQASDQPAAC